MLARAGQHGGHGPAPVRARSGPADSAEQVGPLKQLLEMRGKLNQLLSKMEGNDKLEKLLNDVIGNTEKAQAMKDILKTEGEDK